jgi:proliferating cell nuclear antigen
MYRRQKNMDINQEVEKNITDLKPVIEASKNEIKTKIEINICGSYFKQFVKSLNQVNDTCIISFNKTGFNASIVDPAHVAMITNNINVKDISLYVYESDQDYLEIGIDLDRLNNIVKTIKKYDNIKLVYNQELNVFEITINNVMYTINCLTTDNIVKPRLPVLQFLTSFNIPVKEVYDFLKNAAAISDHISITTEYNSIVFEANKDNNKIALKLLTGNMLQKAKSLFAIDYLLNIFKDLVYYKAIDISLGNDFPLKIEANTTVNTSILLAPRIESE